MKDKHKVTFRLRLDKDLGNIIEWKNTIFNKHNVTINNQLLIKDALDNTYVLEKQISSKNMYQIKSENNSLTNNETC